MPVPARRIVVIDPAFVGDTAFDAPLVRALRAAGPSDHLGLVVRPPSDAVARRMPGLDRIHVFDKRRTHRGAGGLRTLAAELRGEGYGIALIPHPSPRSTALALLARIPRRIGNAPRPARWLLTDHVDPTGLGFVEQRLALARILGDPPGDPLLVGSLRRSTAVGASIDPDRVRIGLVLGAAWQTKRWPIDRAAELVSRLDPCKHRLIFLGSEDERSLFGALRAKVPQLDALSEDASGGSLDQLLERLETCQAVIAGDTGPLHLARALGIPVIALFGPTPIDPHTFGPRDRVLSVELPCRPCHPHGPAVCPLGHHRCLVDLSGERVAAALSEVLA